MDVLTQKRITDNGEGMGYFRNCIDYCYKEKQEPGESLIETKGYGVSDTNEEHTYEQMNAVKEYFGKTGDNPVMHFVVAYDKKNVTDSNTASAYTQKIAGFFKNDYQMITAIHQENQRGSLYHAHIVMNTVNINTGKLYHSGIPELQKLAMHVNNVTGNYCKPIIKKPGEK